MCSCIARVSASRVTVFGYGDPTMHGACPMAQCMLIRVVWLQYTPTAEDLVIGTVVERHPENYRVHIGGSQLARLPALAFEGATKRSKPNIQVGALIYARVDVAIKDMEPELSCTSPHFKKEWVTGQSFFGELTGGYSFDCSLRLARRCDTLLSVVCAHVGLYGTVLSACLFLNCAQFGMSVCSMRKAWFFKRWASTSRSK